MTLALVLIELVVLIAYFMILPGGKSHREARGYVITWACLALYQIAKTVVTDQVAGRLNARYAKSDADWRPLLSRNPDEFLVGDRVSLHGIAALHPMSKYNRREGLVIRRLDVNVVFSKYTVRLSGPPSPGDCVVLSAAGEHVVVEVYSENMRKLPFTAADLESGEVDSYIFSALTTARAMDANDAQAAGVVDADVTVAVGPDSADVGVTVAEGPDSADVDQAVAEFPDPADVDDELTHADSK